MLCNFEYPSAWGAVFAVEFTGHFIRRYEQDRFAIGPDGNSVITAPAPSWRYSEQVIVEKIREGLGGQEIFECLDSGAAAFEGLITSVSLGFSVSFALSHLADGRFLVRMKNVMMKHEYKPFKGDCRISVNPPVVIQVSEYIDDPVLRSAMIEHFASVLRVEKLRGDTVYHLGTDEFTYWVDPAINRHGELYYLCDPEWSRDLLMVEVA